MIFHRLRVCFESLICLTALNKKKTERLKAIRALTFCAFLTNVHQRTYCPNSAFPDLWPLTWLYCSLKWFETQTICSCFFFLMMIKYYLDYLEIFLLFVVSWGTIFLQVFGYFVLLLPTEVCLGWFDKTKRSLWWAFKRTKEFI